MRCGNEREERSLESQFLPSLCSRSIALCVQGTHEDKERLYTTVPVLFVNAIWKYARSGTALFFHFSWKRPDYRGMAKDLHNRAEGLRKEVTISENFACARLDSRMLVTYRRRTCRENRGVPQVFVGLNISASEELRH